MGGMPGAPGGMPGGMPQPGMPGGQPSMPPAQAKPAAPPAPAGEPLPPHELEHCKQIFGMLLDASSQDGNVRKREDNAKRLEDLYGKLASGTMSTASSQKVVQIVKAVEAQDLATAMNVHKELSTTDWDTNKNWLVGVQRLLQRR